MKKGWEIKKIGEVCEIELGKTPYRKDKSYWDTEKQTNNVWLSISDLLNVNDKFVSDSKEYISDKAVSISKIVKKGTLLLSFKLTIGRLAFAGRDLFTNEAIAALSIKDDKLIDKFYLYNYLLFFDWDKATEGERKVKGKTLNKAKLKELEIIIPLLPEQQRIVSILDRAFEAIDKAKANAEQNLKNAKEVFQSKLQAIFDNGKLKIENGEWEDKTLGEVCEVIAGQSPESKFYNDKGEGLPFYQGKKEFTDKFIGEPIKWTTKITKEAQKDDILMSVRAPVGPVNFSTQKICIGRGLAAIRCGKLVDIEFVFDFLKKYEDEITGNAGAVFNSINKKQIKQIPIPIPPLHEQKQIVSQLDKLQAETKKLELVYKKKIENLEELKKSVLQKAFNGELTEKGVNL